MRHAFLPLRGALLLVVMGGGVLWGGVARGQTLQESLSQAYANNPALLAARAQLRVVDENVPQALGGWRPTVSLG
ncbi:TolC family protein, partial [Teichococcus vastitatis]